MGRSRYSSTVSLPDAAGPYPPILDFLCLRFPAISRDRWGKRIAAGMVLGEEGHPITLDTPYVPRKRLFYFRDSPLEPVIPGEERILFQDGEILVADKPHFLPVVPAGPFVEECLLTRLRRSTGVADLVPIHRIDRETAGLVLFSLNRRTRAPLSELFRTGGVEKEYQAVSASLPAEGDRSWVVEDRLEQGDPWFRMRRVPGPVNARTVIELTEVRGGRARFRLRPLTGKKHQLRLHLSSLGFGILNDRVYPVLQPQGEDDHGAPLQLLAHRIAFPDPVTGEGREFISDRGLA